VGCLTNEVGYPAEALTNIRGHNTQKVNILVMARVLVTGQEIWLPTGNRVSRAPQVNALTGQQKKFEKF
jgi:hypothetical protein